MYESDGSQDISLRAKVYTKLKNDILNGIYDPGESLIELKLSDEFGVSRTPVREALRQLELDGLVRSSQNRGAFVTGLSRKDICDIYDIRMLVEGLASKWAAETITTKEIEALKEVIDLEEFYTIKEDVQRTVQFDGKFHDIIFEASKSRPLNQILKQFHEYIRTARNNSLASPGRSQEALEEHKAIFDAICCNDAEKAEILTVDHIKKARYSFIKTYKEQERKGD